MNTVEPEKPANFKGPEPVRKGPGFQYYEQLASQQVIYFDSDGELCHLLTQGQIDQLEENARAEHQ